MKFILNRFNEQYIKSNSINIRFFDEEPLTTRKIRYNQSGAVCYCMENQNQAKQKVSNLWKDVNCSENCKYRQTADLTSKPACNVEGTLKFLLPKISEDRIFVMKITGQTSIKRLQAYIELQKQLGNSLVGNYTLFLKQEEQTNKQGKTFNNYILDIIKKEDFISNTKSVENSQKQEQLSTIKEQNVDKIDVTSQNEVSNIVTKPENKVKKDKDKENIAANSKTEESKEDTLSESKETDNFENYYFLIDTSTKDFIKDGKPISYVIGNFVDMHDKTFNVIIPPDESEELLQCDAGTNVILNLTTRGDKIFTEKIEYVQKILKNVAA